MAPEELYAARLQSWQAVSWRKVAAKQYGETDYSTHSPLVRSALYQPSVLGTSFLAERSALAAAGGGGDIEGGQAFGGMSKAKLRWQKAVTAIIETKRLQQQAHVLCNPESPPAGEESH